MKQSLNLNLIVLILINLCLIFFLNSHKETFYDVEVNYSGDIENTIKKAQDLYGDVCTTEECIDDALNSGTSSTTTTIAPTITTSNGTSSVISSDTDLSETEEPSSGTSSITTTIAPSSTTTSNGTSSTTTSNGPSSTPSPSVNKTNTSCKGIIQILGKKYSVC